MVLSGDRIRHHLKTKSIGQNVIYVPQTGSTNTELKKLARSGAPEGLLYITDEQLVGRGRLERSWFAPAGSSLLTSLLFRPGDFLAPAQLQRLTMLCALAMLEAIERQTGLAPGLKWPNDLVWRDSKKIGGILTESEIEGDRLNWVVVGLGLNVNVDFSQETQPQPDRPGRPGSGSRPLAEIATSLSMLLGENTSRLPILQAYLEHVERRYEALKQGDSPYQEWQDRLIDLGRPAAVTVADNERYEGIISGVDQNGALCLQQSSDGSIIIIPAGDVTLK
jgi:BirA family biotin operon repressor/biotin-[acetyl-CoA-carboxylase] ligase